MATNPCEEGGHVQARPREALHICRAEVGMRFSRLRPSPETQHGSIHQAWRKKYSASENVREGSRLAEWREWSNEYGTILSPLLTNTIALT